MKIYIDTSVINGLFANDALWIKKASELFFELAQKKRYKIYISDLLVAELERTPDPARRRQLLQIIKKHKFEELDTTESSEKLAQKYLDHAVIPHKYLPDALHIAVATVHKIPVIVSWNFKHIVRHKTRVMVNKINKKIKFIEIDICSPEEVD